MFIVQQFIESKTAISHARQHSKMKDAHAGFAAGGRITFSMPGLICRADALKRIKPPVHLSFGPRKRNLNLCKYLFQSYSVCVCVVIPIDMLENS